MTKPNRLQAALREKAQGDTAKPKPVETTTAAPRATTRQGKVMVSGWLPLEAKSSFRLIQAKHPEKLMQDLIMEAFNDLFAKYNVPQTAKAEAKT
jgi:hypothetical protein